MRRQLFLIKSACLSLIILFGSVGWSDIQASSACQTDNKALRAMGNVNIDFVQSDGSTFSVNAKLASDNFTRAAGFQNVCESRIQTRLS